MIRKKIKIGLISVMICLGIMGGAVAAEESALMNQTSSTVQVFLVEDDTIQFVTPEITSEAATSIAGSESLVVRTTPPAASRGTYLAEGGCGISRLADNIARVNGYTNCYRQAEYIYLGLYMDRLEDGYWHTVWYKDVSAEDAYSLSYAINVLVKEGYYYRLRAAHVAESGSVREVNTSATNGIPFGDVS